MILQVRRHNSDKTTNEEIQSASVILLIYDSSSYESKQRLSTEWLPRIEKITPDTPVIIVGNKVDKRAQFADNEL